MFKQGVAFKHSPCEVRHLSGLLNHEPMLSSRQFKILYFDLFVIIDRTLDKLVFKNIKSNPAIKAKGYKGYKLGSKYTN